MQEKLEVVPATGLRYRYLLQAKLVAIDFTHKIKQIAKSRASIRIILVKTSKGFNYEFSSKFLIKPDH